MDRFQFLKILFQLTMVFLVSTVAVGYEIVGVSPIQIIHRETPHYPQIAQLAGMEGIIRLSVPVDWRGQVGQPTLIEPAENSPPTHILSWAAIWAARRSKFKPATENGGPVSSTHELTYEFICPRDSLGNPMIEPAVVKPPRGHTIQVQADKICLFGHWLSGEVEVIQVESRIYVGGIRVYLPPYTRDIRSNFSDKALMEDLVNECNWLQRDLLKLGKPWDFVDSEVSRLISEYPAKLECEESGAGVYQIRIGEEKSLITVMKEYPPFDYTKKQERVYLGKAEGNFFKWLSRLESGNIFLKSHFVETIFGENNPKARVIGDHLEACRKKGKSRVFSLGQLDSLEFLSEIEEMLLEPEWVFRQ